MSTSDTDMFSILDSPRQPVFTELPGPDAPESVIESALSARERELGEWEHQLDDWRRLLDSPYGIMMTVLLAFRNLVVFWKPVRRMR